MQSSAFTRYNRMFNSVLKKLKEAGKDTMKHWPPISAHDLTKIKSADAFNLKDPEQLQWKVFFDIQIQFARRGHGHRIH